MNEAKARAMKEEMENLVRDSKSGKTMSAQEINRLGGDRLKFDKISDQKVAEAEEKLRKDRMNALQEEMRLFEVSEMKKNLNLNKKIIIIHQGIIFAVRRRMKLKLEA